MAVQSIGIVTKGGKPLMARQFVDMTRARVDSLLASFPRLIKADSQHTMVETNEVRYLYQPLEDLHILLITDKDSNIVQDVDTLHLVTRVVSDICRSAEEQEVIKKAFDLMMAFDEIISLGYRENVNLMQIKSILEMESHEEKIQDIISRNKEAEAKEELKRRAKQLEMQRREQQRRTASGGIGGGSTGYGGGMGSSTYSPVSRFEAPSPTPARNISPAPSTQRAPVFKGSGMKLGSKKTKQSEFLEAIGAETSTPEESLPSTPVIPDTPGPVANIASSLPTVKPENVHIVIKEVLSLSLLRDGGMSSMDLKGDMNLTVGGHAFSHLKIALSPSTSELGSELQFKQHPNVAKFFPNKDRIIALKDPSKGFPVGQALGVLRWRYTGKDESFVPLSINCWPAPSNDGVVHVNIEYELENDNLTLLDTVISIPLPAGSYPTVTSHTGEWSLNPSTHSLEWSIPIIASEATSGTLEFNVGGDDPGAFFPVEVRFVSQKTLSDIGIASIISLDTNEEVTHSEDVSLSTGEYLVT